MQDVLEACLLMMYIEVREIRKKFCIFVVLSASEVNSRQLKNSRKGLKKSSLSRKTFSI